MKEKIIQGGIVNGVKMLVCPTWEEDFQTEIHKTGGCLRISMNYSAVDVSYWKELEEIAERYGYDLDEEAKEIINEYVKKYIINNHKHKTLKEMCRELGYTEGWIKQLLNKLNVSK